MSTSTASQHARASLDAELIFERRPVFVPAALLIVLGGLVLVHLALFVDAAALPRAGAAVGVWFLSFAALRALRPEPGWGTRIEPRGDGSWQLGGAVDAPPVTLRLRSAVALGAWAWWLCFEADTSGTAAAARRRLLWVWVSMRRLEPPMRRRLARVLRLRRRVDASC